MMFLVLGTALILGQLAAGPLVAAGATFAALNMAESYRRWALQPPLTPWTGHLRLG